MHRLIIICAIVLGTALPAVAQNPPPARPYKPVAITLPQPLDDASFEAFRQKVGVAVLRKDRTTLARLVVARGFFWDRDKGDAADRRKSGIDNLSAALGLANKEGAGWEMLAGYAEDPTAAPSPEHKGAICAPADPGFDLAAFEALLKATDTDVADWGFPVSDTIDVHAAPRANAPVIERLGWNFVRVLPEMDPAAPAYLRIVTPSGKTGYVSVNSLAPLGNEQLCYVKEDGGWKIGGYIGSGDAQ